MRSPLLLVLCITMSACTLQSCAVAPTYHKDGRTGNVTGTLGGEFFAKTRLRDSSITMPDGTVLQQHVEDEDLTGVATSALRTASSLSAAKAAADALVKLK